MPAKGRSSFKFPRSERLKSRKDIGTLYSQGKTAKAYPIRLIWYLKDAPGPYTKAAFSAPRRNFRRAVDRNLLKRRMREAYRLNRNDFFGELDLPEGKQLIFMCIYTSREILSFEEIQKGMRKALSRLRNQVNSP